MFTVTSSTFVDGGRLPTSAAYNLMGCGGSNEAPALNWAGAPQGTKSFAITMHDPDAKAPGGWWHWVVFNIPASRTGLDTSAQSVIVTWVYGTTSFKTRGYGGPCPPPGAPHHYDFVIYALDVPAVPGVSGDTTGPDLLQAIQGHVLGKTQLTGLYSR
ncbi:MAG TPA: YbhB/YbcL family Raf kinase inhibitor-like protein [Candidatus Eremiobacteraceae bacterium]|nr:YbhB/YbcL family Raf kinase inhibitor-like protein [Candidatus Eremiobacteraceae bacterium]